MVDENQANYSLVRLCEVLEKKNIIALDDLFTKETEVKSESLKVFASTKNKWLNPVGSFGGLEKGVKKE